MKLILSKDFATNEELKKWVNENDPVVVSINYVVVNEYCSQWVLHYKSSYIGGGIVTGATSALIGESGPEVIFPLVNLEHK